MLRRMKKGKHPNPGVLAEIVNSRCVLQLPMNRISQEMSRGGFRLTRQTMARWCIDFGTDNLAPLVFRMFDRIVDTGYMQADETPITIGRRLDGSRAECRQWVFRTLAIAGGIQIVIFYFDETRSTDVLRELLGSLERKLTIVCDSYFSYKSFAKEMKGLITIANCLTHSRRKFSDIHKSYYPGSKNRATRKERDTLISHNRTAGQDI
jgi:Transposase IS66 family.